MGSANSSLRPTPADRGHVTAGVDNAGAFIRPTAAQRKVENALSDGCAAEKA
jgi:hypothetical protein